MTGRNQRFLGEAEENKRKLERWRRMEGESIVAVLCGNSMMAVMMRKERGGGGWWNLYFYGGAFTVA